ncbi:hypothetical protein V495_00551 [Pseudogymnoascus sp. VKM F-4514 (FW-929)]|nr:hypothetical protein V495_00551 [Pseudogymnoascus sp. VKM F-4514 (FW-929)]KFY66341.1 hypothetical protein V497_01003 [Pseudogymnoascus sp. VKM F-4516 (FW-969)]
MAGLGSMLPLPCLSGTLGDATDWVKRLNNHRSIETAKIYEGALAIHGHWWSGHCGKQCKHNSTKMRAKWRKKRTRRLKRKRRKTRARSK